MIIITGAAGFIGSILVGFLNEKKIDNIVCVDRMRDKNKWKNLGSKKFYDLVSPEHMFEFVQKNNLHIDCVIHLGACSATTEEDMDFLLNNNYRFSKEIYSWCDHNNIRLIYASSASTYGNGEAGYSDSLTNLKPLNKYGYSKHLFDLWQSRQRKLRQCVGLKFFNVYGPNEYHKTDMSSLIFKFYNEIEREKQVNIFGEDGTQARDFVYVFDVVKVIYFFISNENINGIFNVGTGEASEFNYIAKTIFKVLNVPEHINYVSMPKKLENIYQWYTKADISKLRKVGYTEPFCSLEAGIEDYLLNYALQKLIY